VLSGGRAIHGWNEVAVGGRKLWSMNIPAVRDGKWYFRELWINGGRRQRARSPNDGFYRIAALPDLDVSKPYQNGQRRFVYTPGEIKAWDNLADAEIVTLHFWVSTRTGIASVDESKNLVNLTESSGMRLTDGFGKQPQLARYYVENAFELLDAPGEWYLDRKTGNLFYMPVPGEEMARAETVAPVLEQLLSLEGDPRAGRLVEHLTFRGLTFEHAEWWLPAGGATGKYQQQGSTEVPAAIRVYGARDCSFEHCTVAHASTYGIHFSRGCERDRIVHSELYDLGAGGIKIGESDREGKVAPDEKGIVHDLPIEETHDLEITDNHIHDNGKTFHQALGIFVGQCYNIHIAHNDIHDLYKNAISVGWTWHFGKSLARGNTIEWNHVHDIGKNWFNDGGGIYTLGIQPGTVIRYNLVHDIGSVVYGGHGIYLDQASSNIVVEKNITYNTTGGGFDQNFGHDNTVRNNIFALGKTAQVEPSGGMAGVTPDMNSLVFERNILYWTPEQHLLRNKWRDINVVMRRNLYWQTDGGEVRFGQETWAAWQARGMDEGSLVADPGFADAARGDFRLKPDTPALKIGFELFDLAGVGPRP
jgi:parallel beta-helix repeat protein